MTTILVCNQKGGVGKSLVADELAFSLARSGVTVSFYDLDSQGGTLHTSTDTPGADVAIVDTPGALQPQLVDWLRAADVIVIPTRTTSRDIAPLQRMQQAVHQYAAGKPVLYVLNGWNRWRASSDFKAWFRQQADGPVVTLPQSEQFVQAGAAGLSVVEYAPRSSAARATRELCDAIRELAGIPKEG